MCYSHPMGEMPVHNHEGQPSTGDATHFVCLCPQKQDQVGDQRETSHYGCTRPALMDLSGQTCVLPLIELCQAAHLRKQVTGRGQVLLLFGSEPDVQDQDLPDHVDLLLVMLCCPEKLRHVDLLHALASGFDRICVQGCRDYAAAMRQAQELELTRVLGGLGRVHRYDNDRMLAGLLREGGQRYPSIEPEVLAVGSRSDTARASAAALLPVSVSHLPLPEKAPYGGVLLDEESCTHCNSCVWVCPADALLLGENGCELNFVESQCFQCGLCISICPQRALEMQPGMDLSANAVLPQPLAAMDPKTDADPPGTAGQGTRLQSAD